MLEADRKYNIISINGRNRSLSLWKVEKGKAVEYRTFTPDAYSLQADKVAANAVNDVPGVSVIPTDAPGDAINLLVVTDHYSFFIHAKQARQITQAIDQLVSASKA